MPLQKSGEKRRHKEGRGWVESVGKKGVEGSITMFLKLYCEICLLNMNKPLSEKGEKYFFHVGDNSGKE